MNIQFNFDSIRYQVLIHELKKIGSPWNRSYSRIKVDSDMAYDHKIQIEENMIQQLYQQKVELRKLYNREILSWLWMISVSGDDWHFEHVLDMAYEYKELPSGQQQLVFIPTLRESVLSFDSDETAVFTLLKLDSEINSRLTRI